LGEVCIIKTGQSVNKILIDQNQGDYPVINSGKEPLGYINTFNTENDPIGITSRGAGVGSITWCVGKYFRGNLNYSATIIDEKILNVRYLYFVLMNSQKQINELSVFNGIPALNASSLVKLKIPIPPLTIQKEIVKILDNFTRLEAELEAELEARKKQYEHYREELLTFWDDVEFRALGDLCDYVDYRGKTPKKTSDGIFLVTAKNIRRGYIDYHTSKEFISVNDYDLVMRRGLPEIGDVLITTEAPCGFVAQVDRKNIALAQRVIKYRSKNELLGNSFLKYYLMGSQFQKKLHKAATGATVKGIKGSKLHKLTIPIPPLSKQKEIVAILDKFDALVNDISTGLPAEIAARKKQYEYYRNQLLEFRVKSYEL